MDAEPLRESPDDPRVVALAPPAAAPVSWRLHLGLLGGQAFTLVYGIFTGAFVMSFHFPAGEMLNAAVISRDLLGNGGSIQDWVLPESSYLVPDVAISALLWIVIRGPEAYLLVFAVVQFLSIAGLLLGIGVHAAQARPRRATFGSHVGLHLCSGLILVFMLSNVWPFVFVAVPYWRGGTLILVLLGVLLLMRLLSASGKQRDARYLVALAVLSGVAQASDLMFAV